MATAYENLVKHLKLAIRQLEQLSQERERDYNALASQQVWSHIEEDNPE